MPRTPFAILLLVVVITRLPFLGLGYGADADAWNVARSARTLWESGTYEPSRLPGYPLMEIVNAPLVATGGALLSNSATLLVFLVLLAVWRTLAGREFRHPVLMIIAVAFAPYLWKNSFTTMDYIWSLTAVAGALVCAVRSRPVAAGILTGLAAGFRPPNLLVLVPLLVFFVLRPDSKTNVWRYLATSLATGLAAFLPLLLRFGPIGWISSTQEATSDIVFTAIDRFLFFGYRSVTLIGIPALIVLIVLIVRSGTSPLRSLLRRDDPLAAAAVAGLSVFLILYWFYPLEREYLLPALLFGLILLDRVVTARGLGLFVALLISLSFVNPDVIRHHGTVGTPGLNIHSGVILEDRAKRIRLLELREQLARVDLPRPSVVMTGGKAELWFENEGLTVDTSPLWRKLAETVAVQNRNPDIFFITSLSLSELAFVRESGFDVYCTDWNREYIERIAGYRMAANAVTPLRL